PGSIKAQTCVSGRKALLEFCDEHGITYNLCGKIVIATHAEEIPRLDELLRRGNANGVQGLEVIGPERLKEIEPHATGIRALYAPTTGIIDFSGVAQAYAKRIRSLGGEILTSREVKNIAQGDGGLIIETPSGEFRSKYLINCAGLFSDQIGRMIARHRDSTFAGREDLRIVPFRGEYYKVIPEKHFLVNRLIYSVPDPEFPFLGVHFTRGVRGEVEAGPNAVLAFAREGYRMTDFDLSEFAETLGYPGFWFMAARYWRTGLQEFHRSLSKKAFVRALQKLLPDIEERHLQERGAGVRAQAVERNGLLVDDFRISETENAIHVRNAPSPGATASLAIGRDIVAMAERSFPLKP
ncbi:MAG: L-2-hydroxyglutarate oxidase, partial [Chloroflexi bacterium]|nr:L-2-hydroxyglutarate oxidase [Chloroflexota bacterium]